jgi:PGF-CTERM protein
MTVDDTLPESALGLSVGVAAVLLALVVLPGMGGVAAAQEGGAVNVSIEPAESEVPADGNTTLALVVEGADNGVAAYDINLSVSDPGAARITELAPTEGPAFDFSEILEDGALGRFEVAMGPDIHEAAAEIVIAEFTVGGITAGESVSIGFDAVAVAGDDNGTTVRYSPGTLDGATLAVAEPTPDDGANGGDDGSNDGGGDDGANDGGGDDGANDGGGDNGANDGGGDNGANDGGGDDGGNGSGSDGDGGDGFGPGFGVVGALVALLALVVAGRLRHAADGR